MPSNYQAITEHNEEQLGQRYIISQVTSLYVLGPYALCV